MKYPRKRTILIAVIALLIIGAVVATSGKKTPLNYTSAKVDRGDVVQTVSATGAVEAVNKVDLKFINAGKIAEIPIKVGDQVISGQMLAKLDTSKLDSQMAEAQAALVAAQANLNVLLDGASSEDIRVAQTSIDNAQIALVSAQQNVQDTKSSSDNDINSAQSALTSAQVALDNAQSNLANVRSSNDNNLQNTYETAWDAVGSALTVCDDALDANNTVLDNDDAQDTLSVLNTQYIYNSNASKQVAANSHDAAESFRASVAGNLTHENIEAAITKSQKALDDTRITLSDTYSVLQSTVTSSKLTQAKLDTLKNDISSQRTAINTSISTLNAKKQALSTQKVSNQTALDSAQSSVNTASSALVNAQNTLASAQSGAVAKINAAQNAVTARQGDLKQAQEKLNQVKAKPSSAKISASQAQVTQAQANVDLIRGQLNDSVILAPYAGVVTAVTGEAGEVASVSDPVVSIIIPNGFQITSNISEVSISKIKVGDEVDITFDAIGADQIFKGKVSEIDPAQTEISGVIYYKVTTVFTADGEVVKSGMTANLDVQTAKKTGVLRIPYQALKEKDGSKYVQTVENKTQVKELPIGIGLKGDTFIEVTSGLDEGQEIATFVQQ